MRAEMNDVLLTWLVMTDTPEAKQKGTNARVAASRFKLLNRDEEAHEEARGSYAVFAL